MHTLHNGIYTVDVENSVILWTGRGPDSEHTGTLNLSQGRLVVADDRISGEFKIDMHTIRSTSLQGHELQPLLEAHLKSDEFFFVKLNPWAWFRIQEARPQSDATDAQTNYRVSGDLELCGESVPISFNANLRQTSDDIISADARLDIDRTRWGLLYGSTRFAPGRVIHEVDDLVGIRLKVRLYKR